MMNLRNRTPSGLFGVGLFLAALTMFSSPVLGSFHLARIVEIFTGSTEYPAAQYVVIMPYANSQRLFGGVEITVYDASGSQLVNFGTMISDLSSTSTNQQPILIANTAAANLFGIPPDHTATGALPTTGLVCFRKGATTPDCVSFGSYTGNTLVGGSQAGTPAAFVPSGLAYSRNLGLDGILQATDDTNDSANDFQAGVPSPGNFAGARIGSITASGNVTLDWGISTSPSYTIHKTDDPATVRLSAAVDTVSDVNWVDPVPNQFPALTCYVVKP